VLKFQANHRYRHMSCLDIDVDVVGYLGETPEYISLIVMYWNRHMRGYQSRETVASVKKAEFWKWQEIPLTKRREYPSNTSS
jgi:hypothetical protein